MSQPKLNDKQLDYVEAAALAVAVGIAAEGLSQYPNIPGKAFDLAEAMLAEREKRYGEMGDPCFRDC